MLKSQVTCIGSTMQEAFHLIMSFVFPVERSSLCDISIYALYTTNEYCFFLFCCGCTSHPAVGNPLIHSSSHQMTNETLAVVELFIRFCVSAYNNG